ncbi:lysophospholipase [Microbulbifer echini]|uniref:Lysophospholipase n=1 Tax=Microbulbifer echini TaxID=1529067 RepID=A0ABV4NJ00_9GAMM
MSWCRSGASNTPLSVESPLVAVPESFFLDTRDGLRLQGQRYCAGRVRAVLCLVHGLGEHQGRYGALVRALQGADLGVYTFDLRGHGLSQGRRGHIPGLEYVLEDIQGVLALIHSEWRGLPLFLYGHSMGGNFALNYVLRKGGTGLNGLILNAPALRFYRPIPKLVITAIGLLRKFYPAFPLNSGVTPQQLSHLGAVEDNYRRDPLVHGVISAQMLSSCYRAGLWALGHGGELRLPTLLLQGQCDSLVSIEANRAFAASNPTFIHWQLLSHSKHEAHNDVERERVFHIICQWIEGCLQAH